MDFKLTEALYPVLTKEITGWMTEDKMKWFETIYKELRPYSCVEIGAWYGLSAMAQGLIAKSLNIDCVIYAVDAYNGIDCAEGSNSETNNEWWNQQNMQAAFNSFALAIKRHELTQMIIPVVGKSVSVLHEIPLEIDVMHQDGNHSYEVVSSEIELYAPRIKDGGYWIADDYKWVEMNGATNKLFDYGFMLVHEHNDAGQSFAVYQKKTARV